MAVIFINRFFYPDLSATAQLLSDLAFDAAGRGRSIHVVTSRLHYDDAATGSLAANETVDGVVVHRVWTSRFGRARLLGRAVDYLTFYLSAFWRLWCLVRPGDVVVAKTDPPLISVVAAVVCVARRAHLVDWLQDLFPEVAMAQGIGRRWGPAYAILRWARTRSLRVAATNVVIGHRMADRVAALGVRADTIRLVSNWSDGTVIRPIAHADNSFRQGLAIGDAFVVAYSGNLGRVHDIATLVEAMRLLAGRGFMQAATRPVRWLFIGGGALTPGLRAEVARHGLTNVTFLPYQPQALLAQSLSAADAHLASLRPEFEGLIVPSKVTGAMAAGRPILFVGVRDGEIGRLIARHDCGSVIEPGDGEALARAITALAGDPIHAEAVGRRARAAFDAAFERSAALETWDRLLTDLSGRVDQA